MHHFSRFALFIFFLGLVFGRIIILEIYLLVQYTDLQHSRCNTMSAYSKKMVEFMDLDGDHHSKKSVECPYRAKIINLEEPLSLSERKKFMTGLGIRFLFVRV